MCPPLYLLRDAPSYLLVCHSRRAAGNIPERLQRVLQQSDRSLQCEFVAPFLSFLNPPQTLYFSVVFQDRPKMCWVAELHYRGIEPPKNVSEVYSSINKQTLDNMDASRCRKLVRDDPFNLLAS